MPFGGMWKIVFWLAPAIAFVFWWVSQKQEQAEAKQGVRQSNFDRDFVQINAEFEGKNNDNSKYWKEKAVKIDTEIEKKEKKAQEEDHRSEEMTKSLKKSEDEITDKDLQALQKMGNE